VVFLLARHLNSHGFNLAQSSIANKFGGEPAIAVGSFVAPALQHATRLGLRISDGFAFAKRVRQRLFTINVFALV
jgi:hypothetical protein